MRKLRLALAVGLVWGAACPLRADDRATALSLIERAVKAHGGAAALAKVQLSSRTSAGAQTQAGGEVPFTSEIIQALPDRVRMGIEVDKRVRILTVIDGDKGWIQPGGGASLALDKERLKEMRGELYVWWLTTLVPLTKDTFTLATVPDVKVGGQPALGVKVSRPGETDTKLYFDQRSGLLVKVERRATEAGVPVTKEYLYSDFKDFDGVKLPAKEVMTVNGKKWYEVRVLTYKFLPKVEDGTFARP